MKRPLSIRARFLLASLVSVPLALGLAALFLISLFTSNLRERIEAELGGHINNLAAAISFQPDGKITRPAGLLDRRFATPYGGLYWQIEDETTRTQLRSESLWDYTLALPRDLPADGTVHRYEIAGPDGQRLLAQERRIMVASPSGTRELLIVAAADRAPLDAARQGFALDIVPYIVGLALFLIAASLAQLIFGLRPLSRLTVGLDRIRERRAGRLDDVLPREFEPVEAAVNRLLDSQAVLLAKARARAGDLAHGLKTPLTVLANDALTLRERGETEIAGEIEHLVGQMRGHVERELVRSRIAASAEMRQSNGDLAAIIAPVVRTLKRTPSGEALDWQVELPEALVLPVDPHDLRELIGNVLENAAKWAQETVLIRWGQQGGRGSLVVEDDGPGVDPEKIGSMTDRGIRHDQQTPGTGLGLSIVSEICDVYGLVLTIENRQSRGLRVAITF